LIFIINLTFLAIFANSYFGQALLSIGLRLDGNVSAIAKTIFLMSVLYIGPIYNCFTYSGFPHQGDFWIRFRTIVAAPIWRRFFRSLRIFYKIWPLKWCFCTTSFISFSSLGIHKSASIRFFQLLNKNMFIGTLKIRFFIDINKKLECSHIYKFLFLKMIWSSSVEKII